MGQQSRCVSLNTSITWTHSFRRLHLAWPNWHQVPHLASPVVTKDLRRPPHIAYIGLHCPGPVCHEVGTSLPTHLALIINCGSPFSATEIRKAWREIGTPLP